MLYMYMNVKVHPVIPGYETLLNNIPHQKLDVFLYLS